MAINETINKIRQRGKFNLNTAKAQFEALQPISYPDNGVAESAPVTIGTWNWSNTWHPASTIAVNLIGAPSTSGPAARPYPYLAISITDNGDVDQTDVLTSIKDGDINITRIIDSTNAANYIEFDNCIISKTGSRWLLRNADLSTVDWTISDITPGTEVIYQISVPAIPPSPQKSFSYIKDHADYKPGGSGLSYGADPISEINVQGKDTYLMVDIEIFPATGVITAGQPFVYDKPSLLYIQLGNNTESVYMTSEYLYKPTPLGQISLRCSTILTEKLEDWEWISFMPYWGGAPVYFEDGSGDSMIYNIRFTNKNIKNIIL